MSRKSLLSALSRRARTTESQTSSSSTIAATAKPVKVTSASTTRSRRIIFDDKSGPSPPRGSLTRDKLSYLDWRLQRINALRTTSERTDNSWIDGRTTIGRNSIDIRQADKAEPVDAVAPVVEALVPAPAPMVPVETSRYYYSDEKEAAKEALSHALAADSIVASMPRLTKRGSTSGSDHSDSDQSGSSEEQHEEAAQPVDALAPQDLKTEKVSFFRRASRRISMRPVVASQSKRESLVVAPHMNVHLASQLRFSSASSHSQRTANPLARVWQRSA